MKAAPELEIHQSPARRVFGRERAGEMVQPRAEEIFQKAAEHAKKDHNMSEIPKEFKEKARSVMREVQHC